MWPDANRVRISANCIVRSASFNAFESDQRCTDRQAVLTHSLHITLPHEIVTQCIRRRRISLVTIERPLNVLGPDDVIRRPIFF